MYSSFKINTSEDHQAKTFVLEKFRKTGIETTERYYSIDITATKNILTFYLRKNYHNGTGIARELLTSTYQILNYNQDEWYDVKLEVEKNLASIYIDGTKVRDSILLTDIEKQLSLVYICPVFTVTVSESV